MSSIRHGLFALIAATVAASSALPLRAQTEDDPIVKLVAEPAELTMRVGEEAEVKITGVTRSGAQVDAPSVRLVGPRSAVRVREGVVTALAAGDYALIATLAIVGGVPRARTGDVIDFGAEVKDDGGQLLTRVPVEWYHAYEAPDGGIAPPPPAQMHGGRFVADLPGVYTDHGLTGGVHNAFPTNDHVFALAGGDKYVILDVSEAYYEGGVRMVDVSGELMGNLYTQGREIAVFKAFDPAGYVPNSPMAWSAMPFKGRIFFSDTNSGLWSARLVPRSRPIS